ncbi:hypothetical protein ACO1O0_009127 [Amphichorda felina]
MEEEQSKVGWNARLSDPTMIVQRMNRGSRGAGRGRAGAAAGSSRAAAEGADASTSRTTPSGSATGTPSRTPSATPGRTIGASRASRAAPAVTGRFRPKAVRRNEAERDTIARQEEKKASDKLAEEKRARGRSRFRSSRSRGDAMGARGGRGRGGAVAAAAGPFSSGFADSGGRIGGGGFFGGGGGGFGGGSGGGGSSRVKGEGRIRSMEGDGPREPRINADRLHVMEPEEELDSDDEAMMAALSSRTNVMPMGIYRKAHKDAGVVVATTAELEAAEHAGEEESLWVDGNSPDTQPPPEQPAEEGVWDTGGDKPAVVKKEPDTETDLDAVPMEVDPQLTEPQETKEVKSKVEVKIKKAPPQDPEDRVIQSDLNLLAGELGAVAITDETGEAKNEGPADKDGRLYLFQFPPLLPPLKAGPAAQKPKSKVKAETEEFSMADAPPATGESVDLTGEEATAAADEDEDDGQGFMSSLLSEGGMMGKLNVRKSGKVELDWGGRILELSPATAMNFLTTAVIVEQNDEKPLPGVIGGDGIGMGKIMGRFVLAPVWGEEEEWEVSPEELRVEPTDET